MKKQLGFTLSELLVMLVWLVAAGGWIANIVKLVGAVSGPVDAMFILRCVGVLAAPLGAVLGFL